MELHTKREQVPYLLTPLGTCTDKQIIRVITVLVDKYNSLPLLLQSQRVTRPYDLPNLVSR